MEKDMKVPKNTYANEEAGMDDDYLTTDFIDDDQSKTGTEYNAHNLATSIDNEQHDSKNVLHCDELPTGVDNSACNTDKGPDYLSPVQYKPFTGSTHHTIGENKPPATPPRLLADRQTSETMYEEIPNIPEYLELEEFPPQAAVQTPAIQTTTISTEVMSATEKNTRNPKKTNRRKEAYRSEDLDDEKYLTTDFTDNEPSTATSEFDDMGNPQENTQKVLHIEDLPTLIDNSACNIKKNQGYLSPVQYKPVTGSTDHIIGEDKPLASPTPQPADRQTSETMYDEIPEIPEYLELEEFPTQAAVQTPAIQTSQTATDNLGATGNHKKNPRKPNGLRQVYTSEDLDDEQYLTTDYIGNEPSTAASEFDDQKLPTSTGNPQRNTQNVLHIEDLPTLIDNSVCNIGKDQAYLPPQQYEPIPGMTDLIIDQHMPQTPPPPLPPDRHPGETMYEEIPGIPEYLELEEFTTQAGIQQPNPVTIRATGDKGVRKHVAMFVTIGVLACIIMVLIALFVTNRDPSNNEEGSNAVTSTQSQGTFTYFTLLA